MSGTTARGTARRNRPDGFAPNSRAARLAAPGVVAPDLPLAFARSAAWGDLLAVLLALLALASLRRRAGYAIAWVFNLWGSFDLFNAFYQAAASGLEPGQFGAAYFLPTFLVPMLLVFHVLICRILVAKR